MSPASTPPDTRTRTSHRPGSPQAPATPGGGVLRVFAAGSLRPAFGLLPAAAPSTLQLQYANARDLAERITAGEPADVFASASPAHPHAMYAAGLVGPLLEFATNRLVVAVPATSPAQDFTVLAEPGSRVVIEVEGIPLGDYARALLARLGEIVDARFAARTFANVVDEVQTVDVVADRLVAGVADAAVLYATDVAARSGQLRAIELPRTAQIAVTCVACVVKAAARPRAAEAWVEELTSASVRALLERSGFGTPHAAG
jgi:molybdate transport system substrate-binding protein